MKAREAKLSARIAVSLVAVSLATMGASRGDGVAVASPSKGTLTIMTMSGSPVVGADTTLGLQSYIKGVDVQGGVDGYQLKYAYAFCSLGPSLAAESANLSATCAHEAVSDHVAAVVGAFDEYDAEAFPILQAAGIPEIGNFPEGTIDYTSN